MTDLELKMCRALRCLHIAVEPHVACAVQAAALGALAESQQASADDIRAAGWSVAVHNDYRIGSEQWTFWLFTKRDRCVKGEGKTDADALNEVRKALNLPNVRIAAEEPHA